MQLVPFSRVRELVGMNSPKFIDPCVVAGGAESWPKKIAGENQPGFLVFDRLLAMRETFVERMPERANQYVVPIGLRFSEDSLEAFE